MTAFILVAGAHTGGWIWREVAARLREAGDRVHPVTLTGMGGRSAAAGPGTDLEAHIGELLELIDRTDAAEVVLVGHCYGVYPVLGAADRRPGRIARIVLLDTGMPQHGDRALALVPDPTLRDRLAQRAEADEDGWRVPRRRARSGGAGAAPTASRPRPWTGWRRTPYRSPPAPSPSRCA
ncbi:alpha/beta fold hydrolase [Actinacidiphila yeochonensis]|uniref:alpha/beta fold hydrolase n=1 Tax=Actinacidiphila yeochonensis TaxID=89050 RepID=UPI00099B698A|nr:alpha/beta fold hydrolase [Actinacidiphila yeochonensis]